MRMRQVFLFLSFWATMVAHAQNLNVFALRGQPLALAQNPGAKTDLRFHVSLPGLMTQGNMTTPLKALWGNVGEQLRALNAPNVGLSIATEVEGLGIGWKQKKGYTWVQTGVDVDARFHLDKDLLVFGFYGMRDATGQISPVYEGNFSESDFVLSAMGRVAMGHQRQLSKTFRVGAAVQANRLLGGFQWQVQDWRIDSHYDYTTQTNVVSWNSDMQISAFGLIADDARLDSAMDFPRYLIMGMVPAYWEMLKSQKNTYSLNLGFTYQPLKTLTLQASATGIPLDKGAHVGGPRHSRSLQWTSQFTYSGYSLGFDPGDTLSWSAYLKGLQSENIDGFSLSSAPPAQFRAPLTLHAAAYYQLTKQHQLGVHAVHIDRLAGLHQSLGIEYQGFFGRKAQLAASYRWHTWEGLAGAGEFSTVLQHRILPWTTLYTGINLWLSLPAFQNGQILLPANFQSWQITAGIHITLFEKEFKEAHREAKARRKALKEVKVK